jgi:hypothetical protein
MKDPIVQEMRDIKRQIEQEFDHDVNRYLDHVYEAQKRHRNKLVRRQPKPLERRRVV